MSGGYITPSPRRSGSTGSGGAPALTHGVAVRIALIGAAALVLMGVLIARLWFLQVIGGQDYAAAAQRNAIREVEIQAPRGLITDRDGKVLVDNRPGNDVVAVPKDLADLSDERRQRILRRLARVTRTPYPEILAKVTPPADPVALKQWNPFRPVVLAADVGPAVQQDLAERRQQYPGVTLQTSYVRAYPHGTAAAHILGFTGVIYEKQARQYRRLGYQGNERVGQAGLELQYEQYLRGTKGFNKYEVDATGEPTGRGLFESVPPRPGRALRLAIDLPTQLRLEDELRAKVKISTSSHAAAGVAMDPRTGEILALASNPPFSPNAFETGNQKRIAQYNNDKYLPSFDRAISGRYPAGSTYKAVTAVGALQEKLLAPTAYLNSPSSINIYGTDFPNFDKAFHGPIQLPTALEVSSDTFFYQLGKKFYDGPTDGQQRWGHRFGFGAKTGIDIPGEAAGIVPDKAYKRELFKNPKKFADFERSWLPGDDVNLSVGQGFLQMTPLQLASAYAAIANGGTVVTPTLARDVVAPDGTIERRLAAARPTRKLPVSAANLDLVRRGLYNVANGGQGTAYEVFHNVPDGFKVAGKTGTAENFRGNTQLEDHSWFVGYAPFDDPKIVVAIIIENGGTGASGAAPAVCQVMATYLTFDPNSCGIAQDKGN
jgi:penicillin-binding protein 2